MDNKLTNGHDFVNEIYCITFSFSRLNFALLKQISKIWWREL